MENASLPTAKLKTGRVVPFMKRNVLIGVLVVLFITLSLANENFLTFQNMMTVLRTCSMNGIIALGMTLVIITGEIDLSVGSAVAFSGCFSAWMVQNFTKQGMDVLPAIIISSIVVLIAGVLIGVFTAWMRNSFQVPSFITTLGLLTMLSGFAYLLTGGFPIASYPQWYGYLGAGFIAGVFPFQALILIVVFFLIFFLLNFTAFGRSVYAVGGNVESARLSGGVGKVTGTLLGILFLGIVLNGMTILGISSYWQLVVRGALVIIAVLLNMSTQKSR